jgi:WD40 repeat protein
VNSQHFHQLLERLSSEETAFFHEVMEAIEPEDDAAGAVSKNYFSTNFGTPACDEVANKLYDSLEAIEQKIPTYRVDRKPRPPGIIRWQEEEGEEFKINYDCDLRINEAFWFDDEDKTPTISFTFSILKPIMTDQEQNSATSSGGVHALSLEYLVELEKNPWRYSNMLQIPIRNKENDRDTSNEKDDKVGMIITETDPFVIRGRIKLRDAIGERRFRAWKIANDHKDEDEIHNTPLIEKSSIDKTFDLSTILANVPELPIEGSKTSTQPHVDANDRDKVRRCLEIAFGSSQNSTSFKEHGRDLIAEAESALRNSSAQRYLFSVLSQRNKIEKQRSKKAVEDSKQRAATQQSVSRLEHGAFECIVRLCIAVLEACQEEEDYESAYRLLSLTGGFCSITMNPSNQAEPIYMTERIKTHSIFADLRLWERVLLLHKEQQNDRKEDEATDSEGEEKQAPADETEAENTADNESYDAAVTTLYEMVGYGVPAEELARFATRISEERGWFATDKGQSLLVLARRLTAKRDEDGEKTAEAGDFSLGKGNLSHAFERKNSHPTRKNSMDISAGDMTSIYEEEKALVSEDISWAHPSISLMSCERYTGARAFLGNILGSAAEFGAATPAALQTDEIKDQNNGGICSAHGYAGRVAITAMATFGSTAVVTGGVDGTVFLAHTVHFGADRSEFVSSCSSRSSCASPLHSKSSMVNGVKLLWGSSGDTDECVTGSVSCLAASKGSGYRVGSSADSVETLGCADEDEIVSSMEGCRIIGGTSCGGLRVWSLKDIYLSSLMSRMGAGTDHSSVGSRSHQGSGVNSITSTLIRHNADDYGLQEAVKGTSIGGHRGGVTCIDIPPRMYRPDSLLSGGEDGLIKLWSLKASTTNPDGAPHSPSASIQSRFFANRQITAISTTDYDTSDAQGVLTGHEGRIICIKTAWHGDKLLSGGADKTIRLWDLSGATKPLSKFDIQTTASTISTVVNGKLTSLFLLFVSTPATLKGHQGWVTETHFWGQIIVSASTDRSIALWDTRAGSSPLFNLRYHLSPVSGLLLGNRSESLMVSAGTDGSLATWDFRVISGSAQEATSASRTIRSPLATMHHLNNSRRPANCGSVRLARAIGRHDFCFSSVCDDGVVNEWEASTGRIMSMYETGHRDAISGFNTFSSKDGLRQKNVESEFVGGSVTCSWDGTVRLRRLERKSGR